MYKYNTFARIYLFFGVFITNLKYLRMFVKNNEMKKILLLIAIGVSSLCVNAQYWATYPNYGDTKKVGDTLEFYLSEPNAKITRCNAIQTREDITNTFFFYYKDSKGRNHYKHVAYLWPNRQYECHLNNVGLYNSFMANPIYYNPLGLEDEIQLKIDSKKTYYTIQGIKIDSPDNYNGAMICEGKVIIRY